MMMIITHLNFGREERGNRVHNLAASHQVEKGEKKIKMTRILAFEVVTHVCIRFYERYFKRDDISSLRNKPSGWSLEIHMICGDSCEKSREHSTKKFKATHLVSVQLELLKSFRRNQLLIVLSVAQWDKLLLTETFFK